MSYQDSTTTAEQRSSRRRLAGGAERGAPMSQGAYSRLRGAATAKPPVAIERVTPHGRPDAAQGVQAGLRGLDGETPSCAGLCGGRTRSTRLAPEHYLAEAPEVAEAPEIPHARLELARDATVDLGLRFVVRDREVVPQQLDRQIGILLEEARVLVTPGREMALGAQVLDDRTLLETPHVRLENAGGILSLPPCVHDALCRQPPGEQRHRGALVVEHPTHEPGGAPAHQESVPDQQGNAVVAAFGNHLRAVLYSLATAQPAPHRRVLLELGQQRGRRDPALDQGCHRTTQADRERVLVCVEERRPDEAFHRLPKELHGDALIPFQAEPFLKDLAGQRQHFLTADRDLARQ